VRFLFVTWDGPGLSYLESLFLPIFRGLQQHGMSFDVLQFRWGDEERIEEVRALCNASAIGYRAVRVWRWGGALGPLLSAIFGRFALRKAIRQFGTQVVMPRSVLPALVTLGSKASRSKLILFDSDGLEIDERVEFAGLNNKGLVYRALRDIEAQMVREADAILVRSRRGADILSARAGPCVDRRSFFRVTNGRDEQRFVPGEDEQRRRVREELGIAAHAPLAVYVGSWGARYKVDELASFAAELRRLRPDARLLVLTGSPDEARAELAKIVADLDAFAQIFRAEPFDVPRYLAAADIGLAPVQAGFATQGVAPVKIGEYLLCGVPVVASLVVGDYEDLAGEAPVFDDRRGVAEAARWVVGEVLPRREEFRASARSLGLSRFSLSRSVDDYLAAIHARLAPSREGLERSGSEKEPGARARP
jgi:glycosyltransferase involved in cell wall biosynthesis